MLCCPLVLPAGVRGTVELAVFFFFCSVQTLVSRQSPFTRQYSREFSESGIRAFQCCECRTAPCGSGHHTEVGRAKSEARRCSGNCHARRHCSVRHSSGAHKRLEAEKNQRVELHTVTASERDRGKGEVGRLLLGAVRLRGRGRVVLLEGRIHLRGSRVPHQMRTPPRRGGDQGTTRGKVLHRLAVRPLEVRRW